MYCLSIKHFVHATNGAQASGETLAAQSRYDWRFSDDTAYDTMKRRKLNKLRRDVEACRRSPQNAESLISIAVRLDLRKIKGCKEPTFVSDEFSDFRPLSIPKHGGRDIPTGTKNNIVYLLGELVDRWDLFLGYDEKDGA
jgi:hypothetical protein